MTKFASIKFRQLNILRSYHYQPKKIHSMISAPYFLIRKLEAFTRRGKRDYQISHDIEDIIVVLDGWPKIVQDVKVTSAELLNELYKRVMKLKR